MAENINTLTFVVASCPAFIDRLWRAESGCDSLGARTSVVKIVSDDGNNALLNYAVKNSSSIAAMVSGTNTEAEKSAVWEAARQGAVYESDDIIRTNSSSRATGVISCSGLLSVIVGDTTAQKQADFKVGPTPNGKMSVSVSPFCFDAQKGTVMDLMQPTALRAVPNGDWL